MRDDQKRCRNAAAKRMNDMNAQDTANLIGSHLRHWAFVRLGLLKIRQDLERRAEAHDLSKLDPDNEMAGFARINATARQHAYGTAEYKAALAEEQPTIDAHYRANSHHPEHHRIPAEMGWLDLIEMVCDWRAAQMAYGRQTWAESMRVNRERWGEQFLAPQWWLIDQVADFLDDAPKMPAAFQRGAADAYQDRCEGCNYSSVGSPVAGGAPWKAPRYVAAEDREIYFAGYASVLPP